MTIDYDGLVEFLREASFDAGRDNMGVSCPKLKAAATAIEALRAEVVEKEARRLEYQKACGRHREAAQIEAEKVAALRAELAATKARLGEAEAENERLRKLARPEWFYAPDGYESDSCYDSPESVIEYAELSIGKHLFEVNCATSLPSLWLAVHVRSEEEMDALDADGDIAITQFATKAEAEAFLAKKPSQ
jgi:hypothetical protein